MSAILAVIFGFVVLVVGADRFVLGAASLARNFGMPPILVGMLIVGFGTSAPEILVSGTAAFEGNTGLSIGNAIGSNIANIALILGAAALVKPLLLKSNTLRREFPVLFIVMIAVFLLLVDELLTVADGLLLLLMMGVVIFWTTWLALHARKNDPLVKEIEEEMPAKMSTRMASIWLIAGLVLLLGSSKLLVWGAVTIATWLGVSDLVIGLTIVALGTSLPELAAAIVSGLKNESDLALGNVIGSNLFNLLAVIGVAAVIHPATLPGEIITRDYAVMFSLTLLVLIIAFGFNKKGQLNRWEGGFLLAAFCSYQWLIYHQSLG